MKCPNCNGEINTQDINVQTDVAQCKSCDHVFKVSEHVLPTVDKSFDIKRPPNGAWMQQGMHAIVIGATTRSPVAYFMVPFMLVWSGFSLGGIYGSQIISGEFSLITSLFGIPFLLGSVIFWSITFMTIAGKVELTLNKYGGKIFTGVGSIGYTQQFTWDEISIVKEGQNTIAKYPGSYGTMIIMEGEKRITFGTGLNASRQYYLSQALLTILTRQKENRSMIR